MFSACGHLNADYGKEENDNQKGHDLPLRCLQGHYSGFVLKMLCRLLQKVQQWAGWKASTWHWRHPRATHAHTLKRTPGLPSLLGQLINQKQSYVLAPRSHLVKGKDRHPGPAVLSLLSWDRPLTSRLQIPQKYAPAPPALSTGMGHCELPLWATRKAGEQLRGRPLNNCILVSPRCRWLFF